LPTRLLRSTATSPARADRAGLLFVATSTGAFLASLVVPRLQRRMGTGALTLSALALSGDLMLVLSQTMQLVTGLVVLLA